LSPLGDAALPAWLEARGVLLAAAARVDPPDDGRGSGTRRVTGADGRSAIVKQGPGVVVQARYGEALRRLVPAQARVLAQSIHFDEPAQVLVLEDVRPAERLDALFDAGRAEPGLLFALGEFLGAVHRTTANEAPLLVPLFPSHELRRRHAEALFDLPFAPGELSIEPRLRALADDALAARGLRERIAELRTRFEASRESLVHGDPSARHVWVQRERPRLVGGETAHVGDPAFDLGLALAHVHVQRVRARDSALCDACEKALVDGYAPERAVLERARRYAGVEILRRALGPRRLLLLGTTARAERALALGTTLVAAE